MSVSTVEVRWIMYQPKSFLDMRTELDNHLDIRKYLMNEDNTQELIVREVPTPSEAPATAVPVEVPASSPDTKREEPTQAM